MMADQTAREALTDALKPLLPRSWKVIDTQRNIDERSTTTVQLKQTTIGQLQRPIPQHLLVTFVITITSVHKDIERAERELDDDVLGLVHALDHIDGLTFDTAEKVLVDDAAIGYDITVQIPTLKKQE